MSDFQKPSKRPSINQPLREFAAVGDPDEMNNYIEPNNQLNSFDLTPEEEDQLRRARKEKLNPPINTHTRSRIEFLADIGKMTKDILIGGVTFTLRTLKSREQKQVYLGLVDATNKVDEAYNIKFYTLAYSVSKLDGQPIEMVMNVKTFDDKLKMLEQLEESITDKLFAGYQELKELSEKQFSIKTESDVKEVADALKKA